MDIKNITINDIDTFEKACEVLGLNHENILPDFSLFPQEHQNAMIAHSKLVIITEAINLVANNGVKWVPDWTNGKWDKYYPWFDMGSPAGVGFSYDDYGFWSAFSGVGSRLCFVSSEAAEYAGETFIELYKEYFVLA